jgi:hypothetical protein
MTTHARSIAARRQLGALLALVMVLAVGCGSTVPMAVVQRASPGPSPAGSAPTARGVADALPTPGRSTAPAPVPTATPAPSPSPEPAREAFNLNLYRTGDYVSQYTLEWCVGASLQMALNMTTDEVHTSRASQQHLWEMAQARSDSPFGGANPRGWTAALNDLGIGPYVLVSIPDYDDALRVAATAIAETRRPVGLVMWRGRHAWVMSGFESIGDPALVGDATITGIRVLDPLYPRGSTVWGPSPKPNGLVSPATLAKQFVIRDRGRVDLGVPPGYLLILPTHDTSGTPAT